jgi:Tol biopolymer transport system component
MKHVLLRVLVVLISLSGCSKDKTTQPTGDTTPPATVQNLLVTSPAGRLVTLSWSSPGDNGMDGQAARYEIRYSATPLTEDRWDSAATVASPPVPKGVGQLERFNISGLPLGIWHFALKTADEVPNWSAMSNVVSATVSDVIPPAQVTNLSASSSDEHSTTLLWTAPGNDDAVGRATEYDLRYALATITDETWEAATHVEGIPPPNSAGAEESFTVTGLETGQTYYFALKAADEVPNWSALSNVTSATAEDVVPPAAVTDLGIASKTETSATLHWTAPGDNGATGTAAGYDLRHSTEPITWQTWNSATAVLGVPLPSIAGTVESFTVTGLESGQTYYFALKAVDDAANWSELSNLAYVTPGSPLRRLTFSVTGNANSPSWSPDGGSIAFHASWSGNGEIYRMPAAGGTPTKLTANTDTDGWPSWSPDGLRIAFSSDQSDRGGLWVMEALSGANPELLVTHERQVTDCAWSPDGSRIAYDVRTSDSPLTTVINAIPTTGGIPVRLVDDSSVNVEPAWSPDGTRIAFTSTRGGERRIWIMPAAGGDPVLLTSGGRPTWSPDGTRIAFWSDRSGNNRIWAIPAAGGEPEQLTFGPGLDMAPAWSPDGNRIAFGSNRSGSFEIWLLDLQAANR